MYKDNEKKINESLLNANIKLSDENKLLKRDIKDLKNNIKNGIEYILNKSIEYKPGYRRVDLNTKNCKELMDILESELYE